MRKVATVRVVTHLIARAKDMEWILPFVNFLDEIWHHMTHCELHVSARNLCVTQRPLFAGTHAIERTYYGVRQLVLLPCPLGEVLAGKLLESVRR